MCVARAQLVVEIDKRVYCGIRFQVATQVLEENKQEVQNIFKISESISLSSFFYVFHVLHPTTSLKFFMCSKFL
jgi:hypothetical protein